MDRCLLLIPAVVAVLATAMVSTARADGSFFIEKPKLGLGASYEYEEEKRTLSDIETKTTTHDFREQMTIRTNGWVYHPNLMKYRLSFDPGWRQETFRHSHTAAGSTESDRDTSVLGYDVGTLFFKQKPCSLDIFANRSNRQIDLSYAKDTDIETETWGSRLNYKNGVLPFSIGFINRQTAQTGFYRSDEDRNEVQARIRHNLKRSVSELNFLHDDTEKTTRAAFGSIDLESNTTHAELTNNYFFTGDERIRLDSFLYMGQAEYNDIQFDMRQVTENFFWTHSENLLTQYTAHLIEREVDGIKTEEQGVKALLTHHLADTLTTNLGGEASFNDFDGASEDRYRADLGFIYFRPIPGGNIELGVKYDYGRTNRDGPAKLIPTESRHILTIGEEAFLKDERVLIESIVVTDVSGAIVYTENIDYRIIEVGPEVRISRSLLGDIADGQEVVVRYSYRVDEAYDDARFGQEYRFDLGLWSFMNLTYAHRRLDQSILSGDSPAYPIDNTLDSVHLRFDAGWSETRFEYEDQDRENGTSLTTKSMRELIKYRVLDSLSIYISGHYGRREFTDTKEKEKFYTVGTDVGWSPDWWCTFSLISQLGKISGDRQDMRYSEISPKIRLTYGVWTASLAYRMTDQEDRDFDDSLLRNRIYCVVNRSLW